MGAECDVPLWSNARGHTFRVSMRLVDCVLRAVLPVTVDEQLNACENWDLCVSAYFLSALLPGHGDIERS